MLKPNSEITHKTVTKLNKFRENYIPFTLARIYNGHIIDKMKLIDRKTTYAAQILKKTYTFKKN